MSFEAELTTVLKTQCQRTFPDVAPLATAKPYVTYQFIGGEPLRYTENTPANKRFTLVQVNVWAATRLAANALAHLIEEALCDPSTPFTAGPVDEIQTTHDDVALPDAPQGLYGTIQTFSALSTR